jgi:ribosomal protein L32
VAPQLALASSIPGAAIESSLIQKSNGPSLADCLWLAVPKRKVTPGKKRMKTTNQNRIKKKDHIIVDKRTGETTLRHRLPFNWKEYLPGN